LSIPPIFHWHPLGRLDADRHIDAALSHNGEGGAFQWVQIDPARHTYRLKRAF
jgi:hypothetical protein